MPVSEGQRRAIYVELAAAHGEDVATNIMELLPRLPHEQLATREDLAANTQVLRAELAESSAALRVEIAELGSELRNEMAELRSEVRTEMARLAAELRTEMAQLKAELVTEFRSETARLYRWGAALIAANAVTSIAVIVG